MEFNNDKQIDQTIKFVYYFISGILCLFLILLTDRILNDLGNWVESPKEASFENKRIIDSLTFVQNNLKSGEEGYAIKDTQLTNAAQLAEKNYQDAKESFENWLKARKVLGEPSKDREVIAKTENFDSYYKIRQEWNKEALKITDTINIIHSQAADIEGQINKEKEKGQRLYASAVQSYELKVFFIRLLFILPILLLGIYFYVKYRKNKFWPIYFGFSLYSLYAFFVGLVPYLPYYGGYVRYTVGIALSLFGGYYAINNIRAYLDSRKKELRKSTEERSKMIESETAFKAYDLHICPSCGKDFIYRSWTGTKQNANEVATVVSNFCRQCGFELFKNCEQCGEKHFAYLPFCSNCGCVNRSQSEKDSSPL